MFVTKENFVAIEKLPPTKQMKSTTILSSSDPPSAKGVEMSTVRPTFGNIARRRIVPPKPPPKYVTWYVKLADRLHKGIVLTCVGVTGIPHSRLHSDESLLRDWSNIHVHPKSQKQR
jgi:Cytochrome oxidase c assembly